MKTLKLFFVVLSIFTAVSVSFAQDEMMPPPPIQNETFQKAIGEWVAEPYMMMGMNMTTDKNVISMIHNGQFMMIEVDAIDGLGNNYTATIFTTLDNKGDLKGWAYDTWGYNGMMTYTGSVQGNVMTLSGSNQFVSETRIITIEDNKMIHNVDFTVKLPTGDINEKLDIVYNRK